MGSVLATGDFTMMTRLSMRAMVVVVAVLAVIPPMSTKPSGQDGLATLTISDTVIQMATCDSADVTKQTLAIDMREMDSSGSKLSHLASAKGKDTTPGRNPQYNKTLAAEVAIKEGNNPHLTIMLAKSRHPNLEHDIVKCFYHYDGVTGEQSKMATILPSYPAKSLEWKIPVGGAHMAAEDVSVEIEVEANGELFVFDSARQPKESMEIYPQSDKKGEAAGPPLLFIWRRPTSNNQEFLLTVFAATDSSLAIGSLRYTCRLKVGDDYIRCNSATQATSETDNWKIATMVLIGVGVLAVVVIVILAVLLVCFFRRGRRRGDNNETALQGEDPKDIQQPMIEQVDGDMDVRDRPETQGIQVTGDNDLAVNLEDRV